MAEEILELTANDFLNVFRRQRNIDPKHLSYRGGGITIKNVKVTEKVKIIHERGHRQDNIHLDNCIFEESVEVSSHPHVPYNRVIEIEGATFNGELDISGHFEAGFKMSECNCSKKVTVRGIFRSALALSGGVFEEGLEFSEGSFGVNVTISGGEFKKPLHVSGGKYLLGLQISGGKYHEGVEISGGVFRYDSGVYASGAKKGVCFEGTGEYEQPVIISGGEFVGEAGHVQIKEGTFNGGLVIRCQQAGQKQSLDQVMILGGEFGKEVIINSIEVVGKVSISAGTFRDGFSIEGGRFGEELDISGGIFMGKQVGIEDASFLRGLVISKGEFKEGLELQGVHVEGEMKVSGGNISGNGLLMKNCNFASGGVLITGDCTTEGMTIEGGEMNVQLEISGGQFVKKEVIIKDLRLFSGLAISNGTFTKGLNITESNIGKEFEISGGIFSGNPVSIKNTSFSSGFLITDGNFGKSLVVEGCTFMGQLQIQGGTFLARKVHAKKNTFKAGFLAQKGKVCKGLTLHSNVFEETCLLEGQIIEGDLNILGENHFKKRLEISNGMFPVKISGSMFYQTLVIKEQKYESSFVIEKSALHEGLGITKCVFFGKFQVTDTVVQGSLRVTQSVFGEPATIREAQISDDINILGGRFDDSLEIAESGIEGMLVLAGANQEEPAKPSPNAPPENVSQPGRFNKLMLKSSDFSGGMSIGDGTSIGFFLVEGGEFRDEVVIEHAEFGKKFSISAGDFQSAIYLKDSKLAGSFSILGGKFQDVFLGRGCIFDDKVLVAGGEVMGRFEISGAEFKKAPEFSGNAHINELVIASGGFRAGILFSGGRFGQAEVGQQEATPCVGFLHGDFDGEVKISGGTFLKPVCIMQGIFNEKVLIDGGKFENLLSIEEGIFRQGFTVSGGEFAGFVISGGDFEQRVAVSGGSFIKDFVLLGGRFEKVFHVEGGRFLGDVVFKGGVFVDTIHIDGGMFAGSIYFVDGEYHNIDVDNGKVENSFIHCLSFKLSTKITSQVIIKKGAKVNVLSFAQGIASSGMVYVESINLNQLIMENFTNKGTFELTSIRANDKVACLEQGSIGEKDKPSQVVLCESNLDNIIFNDVDFDSFDAIEIEAAKLNLISTIQRHFPTKGGKIRSREQEDAAGKIAEIYSQLYLAMQKQGYKTQEMEYYAAYLYWEHKAAKGKRKTFGKWLSLSLHKYSTDFGQSWLRGIGLTLFVGWLFYLLFSCSLGEVRFGWQHFTWNNVINHTGYYFQFLLPTHKTDFLPHAKPMGWAIIWDFAGRIVVGYLIYQTIAAFRRFGRK